MVNVFLEFELFCFALLFIHICSVVCYFLLVNLKFILFFISLSYLCYY